MEVFLFFELSEPARENAYQLYCDAMDDDLNRDNMVSFDQYGAEAEWDGLLFDANGVAI